VLRQRWRVLSEVLVAVSIRDGCIGIRIRKVSGPSLTVDYIVRAGDYIEVAHFVNERTVC